MKLHLDDIKATPKSLAYAEEVDDLNARLARGVQDFRIANGVRVEITYHRAGLDVFLTGRVRGEARGACGRCAEEFSFPLEVPMSVVLAPRAGTSIRPELTAEDLSLSFFDGQEIDLTPLVHEQLILALPTRPLCREDCRGLCSRCGANLNQTACGCPEERQAPRFAVLDQLVRQK